MKYFITGGCGLIGGWIIKKLLDQGHEVFNFDSRRNGTLPWHGIDTSKNSPVQRVPEADVRDQKSVRLHIARFRPDVVIHLAAQSGVEAARAERRQSYLVNVNGTVAVLESCLHEKVPLCIVASSNHVYGPQSIWPVPEGAALNQRDWYSVMKICIDVLSQAYHHNYDVPTITVRNTNTYGPCDPHKDHIIPGTIDTLIKGKTPVIRGKGLTAKSYLYIEDCADAYLYLADHAQDFIGKAVNVSGATPIRVNALVDKICHTYGVPIGVEVQGKPNDMPDEYMDDRLLRLHGWEPKVSLEEGLRRTIEWQKEQALAPVP